MRKAKSALAAVAVAALPVHAAVNLAVAIKQRL